MKRSVLNKINFKKSLQLTILGMLLSLTGLAQTYTTLADGNWNSASTWVGGVVPSRTISSGMTVNINHDVNCNLTGDISISGVLNIVGDTLRFASSFDKKITINASGLLVVKNGGFFQDMPSKKCDMIVNGGRIVFENAIVDISKNFTATSGTRRLYKNAIIRIGDKYELQGTLLARVTDTIQNSTLEIEKDFEIKSFCTVRVANAKLIANDGGLKNEALSDITVLPGATSNYGFNLLKLKKDLDNDGSWNARIDAYCIDGSIKGNILSDIDFTRAEDCSVVTTGVTTAAPELVFSNPVLKSGQANKEGAIYRFANITTGIDAEIKLKKFSSSSIVMSSIDLPNLGWDKAFQPQFGLPGLVAPWQNWFIDFEMTFYKAGTNTKQKMAKVDLTALDVDGDGWSISEYAVFETPSNITYSTVSYLTGQAAGLQGQTFTCSIDAIASPLTDCGACGGDGKSGIWNIDECSSCDGSGLIHDQCDHAFEGVNSNSLQGPVENFVNIDTLATQVMATYQYVDKDRIKFRYGAKSAANSSNGSGIRLNSVWFRQFSLSSPTILPVKLSNFAAFVNKQDVKLDWTAHEENFSHYVLQRSTDGKVYSDVAVVFANEGASTSNYNYTDANVASATGSLFYRLQMVDKTKESKYSDVRVIKLGKEKGSIQLTTYPNPVTDQVRVTLPSSWQGKRVVLELYTSNGVRVQSMQFNSASQTETIQMSKVSKGFYIVKASCEAEIAQQQVIKN